MAGVAYMLLPKVLKIAFVMIWFISNNLELNGKQSVVGGKRENKK